MCRRDLPGLDRAYRFKRPARSVVEMGFPGNPAPAEHATQALLSQAYIRRGGRLLREEVGGQIGLGCRNFEGLGQRIPGGEHRGRVLGVQSVSGKLHHDNPWFQCRQRGEHGTEIRQDAPQTLRNGLNVLAGPPFQGETGRREVHDPRDEGTFHGFFHCFAPAGEGAVIHRPVPPVRSPAVEPALWAPSANGSGMSTPSGLIRTLRYPPRPFSPARDLSVETVLVTKRFLNRSDGRATRRPPPRVHFGSLRGWYWSLEHSRCG